MLLNRFNRVIVHGARLKTDAERLYPKLRGRVEIVSHIVMYRYLEIAKAHRLCRSDDPTINILFFGRIYAYKGLDVIIRSVSTVAKQMNNFRVIIAGRGETSTLFTYDVGSEFFLRFGTATSPTPRPPSCSSMRTW